MKRFMGKGLFLAGLFLAFSQASLAGRIQPGDPQTAGDAEVLAGHGYGETLFDSADNKCQHCHNDLYDTWKTSMHAKSWEDPIFQSKYQDFLRLQASKIGASGPTGDYKTGEAEEDGVTYLNGTIQKTGQVCIKCHAPTAFYSSDYKITLKEVGDQNVDDNAYADAKALESNLAGKPGYNAHLETTVTSLAKTGKVYTVSYHIGNSHNREGINCSYCHSIETVRMMNGTDVDEGQYTLENLIKMGPIGPIVKNKGDTLHYSPDASTPDMNAFFALIGPEKYVDAGNTPKDLGAFDVDGNDDGLPDDKKVDGRYTIKSIPNGCVTVDEDGNCTSGYKTGGPFYGPFGVTGLENSNVGEDGVVDLTDRHSLVKYDFEHAVEEGGEDKFDSKHQFAAYGKALCLSCHQRSSLMLNPESADGGITVDPTTKEVTSDHQFLELCSTWTAMSDGIGDNYTDTEASPKCQRCHMEPLDNKTVLHQWDQPDKLFTLADNPHLTTNFLPPSDGGEVGPVAEGYLNNHAFMGANTADFGTTKIKTGFDAGMTVKQGKGKKNANKLSVNTYLANMTAHMFPGAHPMRRVATRVVVTDTGGNKLPFTEAKGKSVYQDVTNDLAVLEGDDIVEGFDRVEVKYNEDRDIVIQGYKPDLAADEEYVNSQFMDQTLFDWVSPDATVIDCPDEPKGPVKTSKGWGLKGCTTAKLITDIEGTAYHFTRLYGRETGKRAADTSHVVRPGFDSNIATDNRLKPNEMEEYAIEYDTEGAEFPLTVTYKVYYLKKGASGKFPAGPDGFYETSGAYNDPATKKKLAIFNVFTAVEIIE